MSTGINKPIIQLPPLLIDATTTDTIQRDNFFLPMPVGKKKT